VLIVTPPQVVLSWLEVQSRSCATGDCWVSDRSPVGSPRRDDVTTAGNKGEQCSPRFQVQIVIEVLRGDCGQVDIAGT
jgi:hypothetical protein